MWRTTGAPGTNSVFLAGYKSPTLVPQCRIASDIAGYRTVKRVMISVFTTEYMLRRCVNSDQQPEHIPCPHPQQVATPTPNVFNASESTLTTPSPNTNPLAMTISVIPPSDFVAWFACQRRHSSSTIPPIKRAIENEGVLRNPMAKATPEGMYLAYARSLRVA